MLSRCDVNVGEKLGNKGMASSATIQPLDQSHQSTSVNKDQNVPSDPSFQYVCDDPNSQRYLCQLKMSKKNAFKNHYLDDQENEEELILSAPKTSDFSLYSASTSTSSSSSSQALSSVNVTGNTDVELSAKPTSMVQLHGGLSSSGSYNYESSGGAIKRGCEDVENETEDDSSLVSSSSFSSPCMSSGRRSPPKKPKFIVTYKEMREFFSLLNEESIREFLKRDTCCLISDKVCYSNLLLLNKWLIEPVRL
jgi:hypothetical protein